MNVSVDELLQIIGTKEAELFVLRKRVQELETTGQAGLALLRTQIDGLTSNGHVEAATAEA